ncbi:hypothetical protein Pmani_010662, partial [Petrolisthes manimaculis]
MQRDQLTRLTKLDLVESILAAPGTSNEHLLVITNKLHFLVTEVAELRKAVTASESGVNNKVDQLQVQ